MLLLSIKKLHRNSGEIPRLTDNKDIVNYGEIPQKQWRNSTQ